MKQDKLKQMARLALLAVLSALLAGVLVWAAPMYTAELWLGDSLFVHDKPVDNRIKIIGIDEASLQEMGPFSEWSRQQAADLLNAFDENYAPAVVAFDVNYFGERDAAGDKALAEAAAKHGNVVMASYVLYTTKLSGENGKLKMDTMYVTQVEKPYDALNEVCRHGYTNTVQDKDNYVRRSMLSVSWNDEKEYSFAYEVYRRYMEASGQTAVEPATDSQGLYGFDYTAGPGMYEVYSYADVLAGRCDPKIFKGSIVFVGAYSSMMMDQYMVPIARSSVMNGVEAQANHVNALLEQRTFNEIPKLYAALLAAVIVGSYVCIAAYGRLRIGIAGGVVFEAAIFAAAKILYTNGIYWKIFVPVLLIASAALIKVVASYMLERLRKKKILNVFRTYMAPQVVEELGKSKNYNIELGGRSREIAVLFVDIRGFTTLSESLSPTQVVGILNLYLEKVTEAIFKNEGTLDKFIGDAVMAVYNAPLDVEDYHKKAVLTGLDIVSAVESLNDRIKKEFNVQISCGVGIHCGRAIVGNIGCNYRMDYTAIGDTVNTAERLESIAKGGQVLLSEEMYEHVKQHFHAEFIGEHILKGKQNQIKVFSLNGDDKAFSGMGGNDGTDADR